MSARPNKRSRYGEKGKSAAFKASKAMVVRVVPRPMVGAGARAYSGPLPATLKTRLIYEDVITINPGAGAAGTHVFSANGVYDPDITGVGHQPRGRDEIAALYNHYTVTAAYIQVRACKHNGEELWGVAVRDDATGFTTINDFAEYRNSKYMISNTIGVRQELLSHKVVPKQFLGKKDTFEDDISALVGANPAEQVYFHVVMGDLYGGDAAATGFEVRISYYVTFSEPKPLAQS